jgi:hypothetical protein
MYKSAHSNDYHVGQQAGRRELREVLREATLRQREPLAARQFHFLYVERLLSRGNQIDMHTRLGEWFAGWCVGMLAAYLEAERHVLHPERPWERVTCSPSPFSDDHFLSARYREATIHVANAHEFFDGIQQGLNAQANDEHQMTVAYLFQVLLVDPARPFAAPLSQDHLVGYLIGRVDQLLHMQTIPTSQSGDEGSVQ